MNMLRLFIAVHLPQEIKDSLKEIIAQLQGHADGIRWVKPANIHLTLKFLGDTPEDIVDDIDAELDSIIPAWEKFEIRLSGCGGFPNLQNPRVIWAGMDGAETAISLAREIDRHMHKYKFPRDKRPLSPHLTLGRTKRRGDFSQLNRIVRDLRFSSDPVILSRVALIRSTLTPQGPIYKDLKTYQLK